MNQLRIEDQISYRWSSMKSRKNEHHDVHIHLARYVRPELAVSFDGQKHGNDRPAIEKLWDDTAIKANDMFARGLWSLTHNSASEWFEYKDKNKAVMADGEATEWYANVNTDLREELRASGVYAALLNRLSDVGAFGFGALYSYQDPDQPGTGRLIFEWVPASECYYTVDREGVANSFIRPQELTAQEAIDERGWSRSKLDQTVIDAYNNKDVKTRFLFLHVVWQRVGWRRDRRPMSNLEYRWAGYYYQVSNSTIVEEHGFRDFPYHVLGWGGAPNVPYPVGIGYRTLPEIRNINGMRRQFAGILDFEANPAHLAANQDEGERRRGINPGDMIYGGMSGTGQRLYEPYYTGKNARSVENEVATSRQLIQEAWHYALFMMQTQRQMTAEEVRSRDAKLIQAMGPFLVLMARDLETIIERVFYARLAAGAYDPMPAIFDANTNMDLKFSGLLAKAAEILEGEQIVQLYAEAQLIAQYDPQAVVFGLDHGAALRRLGGSKSIGRDIVLSAEEANRRREAAAAQQQAAMAAQAAPDMARAAKDGSEAVRNLSDAQAGR